CLSDVMPSPPSFPTRRASDLHACDVDLLQVFIRQRIKRIETHCDLRRRQTSGECGGRFPEQVAEAARGLHYLRLQYAGVVLGDRSEEHTSELQSREKLVCRLL